MVLTTQENKKEEISWVGLEEELIAELTTEKTLGTIPEHKGTHMAFLSDDIPVPC